jgi:hypothetical protein
VNAPAKRRQVKRPKGWPAYERAKAEWLRQNPYSTPKQYQVAMTRIARECGV